MTRREVAAVGCHSLFLDQRAGTPEERHVIMTDLDSKRMKSDAKDFAADVEKALRRFRVPRFYLFETQKGYHGFSPFLLPRKDTERLEEMLRYWGGDGIHSTMSWRNGGAVLRVTPKAGEGTQCPHSEPQPCGSCHGTGWTGPTYARSIGYKPNNPTGIEWSQAHFDFFNSLHHNQLPPPWPYHANPAATTIRLEHYTTTEEVR